MSNTKNHADYQKLLKALAEVLVEGRHRASLSQSQLAQKTNKLQPAIAKLEGTLQPNVALRVIYEVASALDMPLSLVFKNAEIRAEITMDTIASASAEDEFWKLAIERSENLSMENKKFIAQMILKLV